MHFVTHEFEAGSQKSTYISSNSLKILFSLMLQFDNWLVWIPLRKKNTQYEDLNKGWVGKLFLHLSRRFILWDLQERGKTRDNPHVQLFVAGERMLQLQKPWDAWVRVPLKSFCGSHNPNRFGQDISPGWPLAGPACTCFFLLSLHIFVCSSEVIIIN